MPSRNNVYEFIGTSDDNNDNNNTTIYKNTYL